MSPITAGLIGFFVLFALLASGLPISVSMGLVGFAGLWHLISSGAAMTEMAIVPFETICSYSLATLPLFLLMAEVCFASGLSKDLYNLAAKWLGHLPGGIAMATVGGCGGFAAVSASSLATSATMGLVAIPEMKKYKYDPALATGCVAAGGTMGVLIPPSGTLIIYGILTGTSIGKLFIGGIVPGILEALFYIAAIYILCTWKPNYGPRGPSYSFREKVAAFGSCGEITGLVILVLGGLIIGWFTPTEAGAVGAFGAIAFSLIRGRLNWQKFGQALFRTMKTTGMIYFLIIGSFIFSHFLARTTIPFRVADFAGGLDIPALGIMGSIMVVYIMLGCFVDPMAMILLTIPIFFPIVSALDFDPIWFGIILARMCEIGGITPPVGLNIYIIAGVAPDVPMETIFKGIFPFLVADFVHIALLLLVPAVVLFLPGFMMG